MKGSSDVEFKIESSKLGELYSIGLTLDDNFLSFRNLRTKTRLAIVDCRNLWLVSLEGFRQPSARGWKYGHAKKKKSLHMFHQHIPMKTQILMPSHLSSVSTLGIVE
jgi:hypothetical protein